MKANKRLSYDYNTKLEDLVGKTLTKVERAPENYFDQPFFVLHADDGTSYALVHIQDCCESTSLVDEEGRMEDLVGSPILIAEKRTSNGEDVSTPPPYEDSAMQWTFYTFATQKAGHIDLRFFGSSNGYYGIEIDFYKLEERD